MRQDTESNEYKDKEYKHAVSTSEVGQTEVQDRAGQDKTGCRQLQTGPWWNLEGPLALWLSKETKHSRTSFGDT